NNEITIEQLQQKYRDQVNDEPGTDHHQIQNGENENYEAVNNDVEQTLIDDPGLNTFAMYEQTETDLNNPPTYQKSKMIMIRLLEEFKKERELEKKMDYTPRHRLNKFVIPLKG
ncbi:MAG TPA: hypothetical protein VF455_05125, partial [Chryseobacterium sp.]